MALGSLADALSSHYCLTHAICEESNIFIKNMMESYGIGSLYALKLAFAMICIPASIKLHYIRYPNIIWGSVYLVVAANNVTIAFS